MITLEYLQTLLTYDADAGAFTWRIKRGTRGRIGAIAGCLDAQGYRLIGVDKRIFLAHRLAWLFTFGEWPSIEIDHINGDRSDNRVSNLRLATSSQNKANRRKYTGLLPKGVAKNGNKFHGYITIDGTRKHLGSYQTKELAHAAYCEAAQKAFGAYHRAG